MKKEIRKREFGGERPLYAEHDLYLEDVVIHAGESALKETGDITAVRCRFEGKYPLWCCEHFVVRDCLFTVGARAALWHSKDLLMEDCLVEAPKMFREMDGIRLRNVTMTSAAETLWHCRDLDIDNLRCDGADYIFMHCRDAVIRHFTLHGNYSFQWAKNIEIHDSVLHTKDAFWETENVTVYDSVIDGEYLGWHSRNLRLVRCHIGGTQPLCYADGLVLEECTFAPDADLALEYSDVQATVQGHVVSIKNPRSGSVKVDSVGEIIIDRNLKAPGDCRIEETTKQPD